MQISAVPVSPKARHGILLRPEKFRKMLLLRGSLDEYIAGPFSIVALGRELEMTLVPNVRWLYKDLQLSLRTSHYCLDGL